MSLHIKVDVIGDKEMLQALKRVGADVKRVHDAAIEAAAEIIQEAAIPNAPGPEIGREQESNAVWLVGPDKDKWYYKFFETGTPAHFVRPRSAKALRWFAGGAQFSAGHEVSGVAARPFLRPAIDEHEGEAIKAAGEVIKKVLRA